MSNNIISVPQERHNTMTGIALTSLLHNIIREYGTYKCDTFYIDIDYVLLVDKRLLLSHIISAEDFEWADRNTIRLISVIDEYKPEMQSLLDDECDAVYREDMEEAGMVARKYPADNDRVWVRR